MVSPIASKHGRTASNTSAGPPTMIDSDPLRAPTSPPDTGASSVCTPREAATSAISTAKEGALVVMSTSTAPGRAPPRAPAGPSTTSRTSLGKPTMENTTSLAAATFRGCPPTARPPRAGPRRGAVLVVTVTA